MSGTETLMSGSSASTLTNNSAPNGGEHFKNLPKDGHVMVAILKDMGIADFEPRVLNQLMEFSYRYVSTILEDSKILSSHAKKKNVDSEDVKLAVQMFTEQNFTTPPSRDVLLETARVKNATALPIPKSSSGAMRLPPERHCLTACNYKLKNKTKGGKKKGAAAFETHYYPPEPPRLTINPAPNSNYAMKKNVNLTSGAASNVIKLTPGTTNNGGSPPVFKIQMPTGIQFNTAAPVANTAGGKRKREDE